MLIDLLSTVLKEDKSLNAVFVSFAAATGDYKVANGYALKRYVIDVSEIEKREKIEKTIKNMSAEEKLIEIERISTL